MIELSPIYLFFFEFKKLAFEKGKINPQFSLEESSLKNSFENSEISRFVFEHPDYENILKKFCKVMSIGDLIR